MNCWLVFTAIEEVTGEIAIEARFAAALVTVKVAVDFSVPEIAVIVTVPDPEPVARPFADILAMAESDEVH